jgi:microcystin-dependent protein
MANPYVGQILAVAFNFVPQGWLACNGQLVSISQYDVLYALIGTTYGGNGTTNFALPNLQGRTLINAGTGAGQPTYVLGQSSGTESVSLTGPQNGAHSHALMASSGTGNAAKPTTASALAQASSGQPVSVYAGGAGNTTFAGGAIGTTPPTQPHENRQPYLAINYIISPFGVFPSQG